MVTSNFLKLSMDVAVMLGIGALIGALCRGRILLQLTLCVLGSIAYLVILSWVLGTLSDLFSLEDPMGTVAWVGLPYLCFFLLPATLASILVGWLRVRRARSKSAERSETRVT